MDNLGLRWEYSLSINIPEPSFELQVVTWPRLETSELLPSQGRTNTYLSLGKSRSYMGSIIGSWSSTFITSHFDGNSLSSNEYFVHKLNEPYELDPLDVDGMQHSLFLFRLFRGAGLFQSSKLCGRHLRQHGNNTVRLLARCAPRHDRRFGLGRVRLGLLRPTGDQLVL